MLRYFFAVVLAACVTAGSLAQPGLPDDVAEAYGRYQEAAEAGDSQTAMEAAEQAWRAAERTNVDAETTAILADNFAQLAMAAGDYEEALEAYPRVAELLEEAGAPRSVQAETWLLAANAALLAREFENASRYADRAGDLAEDSSGLDPAAQANLMFTSRAYQAHAHWREAAPREAALRAREAMRLAENHDLTDNPNYNMLVFYLGAFNAMEQNFPAAAFYLTEAYVRMPERSEALRHWSSYVRSRLSERERAALFRRIEDAGFEYPEPPTADVEDGSAFEGEVEGDMQDAYPIRRTPADYPENALYAGIEGVALLRFSIDETGRVVDPEVVYSIPYSDFGEAAEEALRRWRYEPKRVNGEPVRRDGVFTQFEFMIEE